VSPCECQWKAWAIEELERLSEARLSVATTLRIIAFLDGLPSDPERDAILEILSPYRDKNT
jgi:hypothetical protein